MLVGLEAGIVPHHTWWRRQWFEAGGRYYHRPRTDAAVFIPDADFYQRVDPPLRGLCRKLHACGLLTTPCCAGHFHGRRYFERRWEEMQREAAAITRGGLWVRDAENGLRYLFRDGSYRLPWQTFGAFLDQSVAHQAWGYLGIFVARQETALHARLCASLKETGPARVAFEPHATGPRDAWLLHVLVRPHDPADAAQRWGKVAKWLAQVT